MVDESADQDSTDLQKCIKCAQELIASRPEELQGASIFAAGKCSSYSLVSLMRLQPWTPHVEGKLYGIEVGTILGCNDASLETQDDWSSVNAVA